MLSNGAGVPHLVPEHKSLGWPVAGSSSPFPCLNARAQGLGRAAEAKAQQGKGRRTHTTTRVQCTLQQPQP